MDRFQSLTETLPLSSDGGTSFMSQDSKSASGEIRSKCLICSRQRPQDPQGSFSQRSRGRWRFSGTTISSSEKGGTRWCDLLEDEIYDASFILQTCKKALISRHVFWRSIRAYPKEYIYIDYMILYILLAQMSEVGAFHSNQMGMGQVKIGDPKNWPKTSSSLSLTGADWGGVVVPLQRAPVHKTAGLAGGGTGLVEQIHGPKVKRVSPWVSMGSNEFLQGFHWVGFEFPWVCHRHSTRFPRGWTGMQFLCFPVSLYTFFFSIFLCGCTRTDILCNITHRPLVLPKPRIA